MVAVAVVAIASPAEVGELLGRPAASTSSEMINLRASWGGALLGVGLAMALLSTRSSTDVVISLLLWAMVGIGVARAIGFVVDGSPDGWQWVWLGAEIAIAAGCAWWLRRRRATAGTLGTTPPP